ncbi:hypothetical protein BX666DRAFT_1851199 [Dichotomocladium elegans]|nr:hypothetical protein BX666DRAFT_1851199 [Dichotomocladium elegans]
MPEQEDDTQSVASDESYNNDALLDLIVGVQSYIAEVASTGIIKDSPLLELQYKMYIYMKQQACDMGYDTDDLYYP